MNTAIGKPRARILVGIGLTLGMILINGQDLLAQPKIVINEILYSADSTNSGGEFIELLNNDTQEVNMGGWVLSDAVSFTFPANTVLQPGDHVIVARSAVDATSFYGVTPVGQYVGALSNGGDTILLQDNGLPRQLVDALTYSDKLPWPTEGDGGGPSLELIDPDSSNTVASNWSIGQPYSPGEANDPGVVNDGDIVISEIMYKPRREEFRRKFDRVNAGSYFEDGDDEFGEYVEICNRGSETVDLSGYWFSEGIEYSFPNGTMIDPGGYLVICADPVISGFRFNTNAFLGPWIGTLDDGGERLTIRRPNGDLEDTVQYNDRSPWTSGPDEFGVSLEVVDINEDNGSAGNWRASTMEFPEINPIPTEPPPDEDGWFQTTITGEATSNRFYMYSNGPGEWLIDDVSIVDAGSNEFVANGTFDSNIGGWTTTGNHSGTTWTNTDGHDASGAAHVVGTGAGTGLTNAFYISSVSGLSPGTIYTLSFWAKHVSGEPTYTARLSGGGLQVVADAGGIVPDGWRFVSVADQISSNTLYMYVDGPGEWLVDNISVSEGTSNTATTLARYRFEEGSGVNIINDVNSQTEGSFVGGGGFSGDTPSLGDGGSNNFSGDFLTNGFGLMTGRNFPFHEPQGDATVEWYAKVPSGTAHSSFFWTENGEGQSNMNIFWNATFAGQSETVAYDLHGSEPITGTTAGGEGWETLSQSTPFPTDQWFHVAIVRVDTDGGGGTDFQWDCYLDGTLLPFHRGTTTGVPPGVNNGWQLCGRSGAHSVNALFDELRFSDAALVPDDFLNGTGGPPAGPNLLPNPSFASNDSGWTKSGNHSGTFRTTDDSQDDDGGSEHIVSTGVGGSSSNSLNQSGIPGIVVDQTYTLSFYARSVSGDSTLTVRFSGLSHLTTLDGGGGGSNEPEPPISGTVGRGSPGQPNSVEDLGVPPLVQTLSHLIEKPTSAQSMPILATVRSDTGLSTVQVQYSRDLSTSVSSVTMFDDGAHFDSAAGDGIFGATIPAQSSQTFVHYWVRATDTSGRVTLFPYDDDPSPTQAYYVYNGEISTGMTFVDLYLSNANLGVLLADPRSDNYVDASMAINGIAYPHIGVRKRGRGSRTNPKHQWKFRFNRSKLYDGNRTLDTMFNLPYIQKIAFDIYDRAIPAPAGLESDLFRIHRNGSFFGVYVAFDSPQSTWLRKHLQDPASSIYKARSVETSGEAKNSDMFTNQLVDNIDYWGAYNKKTSPLEPPDDLRAFIAALNTMNDTQLLPYLDRNVDLDQWYTRWALYILTVVDDFAGHNYYFWRPPTGKWQNLAYDFCGLGRFGSLRIDYGDGTQGDSPAWQRNKLLQRSSANATLRRIYFLKMQDVINDTFDLGSIFAEMDALFTQVTPDRTLDRSRWNNMVTSNSAAKNVMTSARVSMINKVTGENLPTNDKVPTANPSGGLFVDSVFVSLFRQASWQVAYTTDGSDPRLSDTRTIYFAPFELTESSTLRAAAYTGSSTSGNWTRLGEWNFEISLTPPGPGPFVRGDCDGNGIAGTIGDIMFILFRNFSGGAPPPCEAACDANGDGFVGGVGDAVQLLLHGFAGGAPLAGPYPDCDFSTEFFDMVLGCETPTCP